MTLSSLQNGNEVSEKSAEKTKISFIHKKCMKGSFVQLPNWLVHRIARKGRLVESRSWAFLAYIMSLPPETEVDVDFLEEHLGHKERTIYECIGYLKYMKHVRIDKIRDKMGRVIKAEYHFYLKRYGWNDPDIFLDQVSKKLQVDENKEENCNSENAESNKNNCLEKQSCLKKMQVDENKGKISEIEPTSYYARATLYNTTGNTTPVRGNSVTTVKKSASPTGADFFVVFDFLEKSKENWSLVTSLNKFFGFDKGLLLMAKAFDDEKINDKIKYLWGAINKKRPDIEKPQSLKKTTSDKKPPTNPQEKQAYQQEIKAKEIEKKDAFNKAWEEREKSDVILSEKEGRYHNYLGGLTIDEKIKLIESIIPTLNSFTRKRLHLERGIDAKNIDWYFNNGQIKSFVMEGKIDG